MLLSASVFIIQKWTEQIITNSSVTFPRKNIENNTLKCTDHIIMDRSDRYHIILRNTDFQSA